jgi:acyl carrier protein
MDFNEFSVQLSDALDLKRHITGAEELNSIDDWDSLKLLSFIAFADEKFGRQLTISEIKKCKTVSDLYSLLVN